MIRQVTLMSRTCSTSRTVREVIQANGQSGSNQKSTSVAEVIPIWNPERAGVFRPTPASGARGLDPVTSAPSGASAWPLSRRGWQDRDMPGTNLTRDEAATRASLLDVTSYSIDLDLTTGETHFGSTTTIVFSCREPGAETFADLVDATVHEITLNGEPVDVAAYADQRIALTGLQAQNTLVVRADCTYS